MIHRRFKLSLVILALVFAGSGNALGQFETLTKDYGKFPGWYDIPSSLPTAEQYPDTGGVYLRTEYEVHLTTQADDFSFAQKRFVQQGHDLFLVLDERGIETTRDFEIPSSIRLDVRWVRDGKTLREIHADPDHKYNQEDLDFAAARPGDIFEIFYVIYTNWQVVFTDTHFITREHPIIKSELRITTRDTNAVKKYVRVYHTDQTFSYEKKGNIYSMTLKNLPALPDEPMSPPRQNDAIWMQICMEMAAVTSGNPLWDQLVPINEYFGFQKSWDFIPRASRVTGQRLEYIAGLDNMASMTKMIRQAGEGKAAVKAAYEYIMSEAARQGIFSSDVNLLDVLLTQLGHRPQVVLLRSAFRGPLDLEWPSTFQFDRKLLKVDIDGEEIWMDPQFVGCPFGQLPWFDYEAGILIPQRETMASLLISDGDKRGPLDCKTCPTQSPSAPDVFHNVKRETTIELAAVIKTDTTITLDGWYAMWARNFILRTRAAKGDDGKAVLKLFAPGEAWKDGTVKSVSFEHLDDLADTFVIHVSMEKVSHTLGVSPPPFLPDWFHFEAATRQRDLVYPVRVNDHSLVTYRVPGGLNAINIPDRLALDPSFASLTATMTEQKDGAVLEIDLQQKAQSIPAASYSEVRDLDQRLTDWTGGLTTAK